MDGTSRHRIFMDGEGNTGYGIVGKEKENTIKTRALPTVKQKKSEFGTIWT